MQACQLCATRSWGPATLMQVIAAMQTNEGILAVEEPAEAHYVRCDHCHAIASKAIIEAPTFLAVDTEAMPFPFLSSPKPPLVKGMEEAAAIMERVFKNRDPSRLERLVIGIFSSWSLPDPGEVPRVAQELVHFALAVNAELCRAEEQIAAGVDSTLEKMTS